ncbi:hypothetical protein JKF63_04248 [Porcisia hertigi]|uniref:Flagellar attachment zone protein 1 conserved domain-containing protein n=1 Tax=Porcisia hertigi TaxID=2761500 RepID=A0A836IBB7_9TRYP|nr:hypothetical protein JKF63_04248 [Porcisia hertigi]
MPPVAEPTPTPTPTGSVAVKNTTDLHIGDYVGFQRISPNKDWRVSLGKVIGFPSPLTVKVACFDPLNEATVTQDPISEEEVRRRAEKENKMVIWRNREALREDLAQASAKEKIATERLFDMREKTVSRQLTTGDGVKRSLEDLDKVRGGLRTIPSKEWRALRNPCPPNTEVLGMMRSVMLILYEDSASLWEDIQNVMSRPDFIERVMSWDCTVTPMSLARRRRVAALCAGQDVEGTTSGKKRARSKTKSRASAGPLLVAAQSSGSSSFPTLDQCMRAWINAQMACSEAAREQEIAINQCFADQQEQRVLLREINDMRVGISSIQVQMLEMKNSILGIDDSPKPIMPLESYPTDTVFYKRTHPGPDGRFMAEIILRDAIIVNFGSTLEEDEDGYIRLDATQADILRNAIISANVRHDALEMEELLERKEREEQEMADLKARIQFLRSKHSLTAEEEEELAQLEKLYADAERRHLATLSRIADLYACGRGAREITLAIKRPGFCYTRLHCKMSGDWGMILNDTDRYNGMVSAFCDDVSTLLNIPATYVLDIDASSGSLLIDFTVKHAGDMDDEQLQDLINKGDFSALCMFYEKVTFKKTSPLNTSQQQEAYDLEQRLSAPMSISGMGLKQTLADYYNADGTLDEEFSEEVKAHPDYRKAIITIPPLREDYDIVIVRGAVEQSVEDDGEEPDAAIAASAILPAKEVQKENAGGEMLGAVQESEGVTETTPVTETYGHNMDKPEEAALAGAATDMEGTSSEVAAAAEEQKAHAISSNMA